MLTCVYTDVPSTGRNRLHDDDVATAVYASVLTTTPRYFNAFNLLACGVFLRAQARIISRMLFIVQCPFGTEDAQLLDLAARVVSHRDRSVHVLILLGCEAASGLSCGASSAPPLLNGSPASPPDPTTTATTTTVTRMSQPQLSQQQSLSSAQLSEVQRVAEERIKSLIWGAPPSLPAAAPCNELTEVGPHPVYDALVSFRACGSVRDSQRAVLERVQTAVDDGAPFQLLLASNVSQAAVAQSVTAALAAADSRSRAVATSTSAADTRTTMTGATSTSAPTTTMTVAGGERDEPVVVEDVSSTTADDAAAAPRHGASSTSSAILQTTSSTALDASDLTSASSSRRVHSVTSTSDGGGSESHSSAETTSAASRKSSPRPLQQHVEMVQVKIEASQTSPRRPHSSTALDGASVSDATQAEADAITRQPISSTGAGLGVRSLTMRAVSAPIPIAPGSNVTGGAAAASGGVSGDALGFVLAPLQPYLPPDMWTLVLNH